MSSEEEWLEPLRRKFGASLPEHRENLLRLHEANDRDGLIDRAHKLAGIAAMMGAPDVGETAFELEESLREHGEGEAEFGALIAAIDRAMD